MPMVEKLSLLTESESREVHSAVHELKPYWVRRAPSLPFYTLGAASYRDAKENESDYIAKAEHYNPLLWEHLGWLYERLADRLSERLGMPVKYREPGALPGFHIFLAHWAFAALSARIHADLQYQWLDWKGALKPDFGRLISFTLAISLPEAGGGMNVWELESKDFAGLSEAEGDRLIQESSSYYFAHEVGYLTFHSGHIIHQIASPKRVSQTDERITLQGHGLLCDGAWQLYW